MPLAESPDAVQWADRIERGLVRIATVTRLEIGYSARSEADARAALTTPPVSAMPVEHLTPTIEDRALHFAPGAGLLAIAGIERELEEILGVEVDLVPGTGLKDTVRKRVERDLIAL